MKIQCIGSAGGYPSTINPTTSYLVSDSEGNYHLLLDAGSGSAMKLQEVFSIEELDAIWLSHDHPDHVADLGIFQHLFMLKPPKPKVGCVPIYLHPQSNQHDRLMTKEQNGETSKALTYDPKEVLQLGPFEATFCLTTHPVPCYAIKLCEKKTNKTFVYTADSAWNEDLAEFVKGADLLLIECNFPADHPVNPIHYNTTQAAQMIDLSQAKQAVITHIPPLADQKRIMDEIKHDVTTTVAIHEAHSGDQFEVK